MEERVHFSCLDIDRAYEEENRHNQYKFIIKKTDHDFMVNDRLLLHVYDGCQYCFAMITKIMDDGIVVSPLGVVLDYNKRYEVSKMKFSKKRSGSPNPSNE